MASKTNSTGPKTAIGRYMVYTFIPRYANNVSGIVYMGAAILIIIVGLRGLGEIAGQLAIVPKFLLDHEGVKIDANWVMLALFLEFSLLMIMAFVTFMTPEEEAGHGAGHAEVEKPVTPSLNLPEYKQELAKLHHLSTEEMKLISNYITEFEALSDKITKIQERNVAALKSMADTLSR
ncbi:MAG: hypothetical protein KJ799_16825 [Bacteroidetes bacterium]|nr:hypothetical protein [Bacteroidota bacterium]MBU1678248.1 hypothetical protein [Bacteroidota bacterium]MBU2508363.1 hypothetical protein [Bacteroidota bacterium]